MIFKLSVTNSRKYFLVTFVTSASCVDQAHKPYEPVTKWEESKGMVLGWVQIYDW